MSTMDLLIDIGNTNIVFGFFPVQKGVYKLEFSFRITTPNVTTTDEISVNFMNLLKLYHLGEIKLNQVLLSSVVPSVNHNITKMINRYFKKDVIILKVSDIKNIKINYDKLENIGTDRLVNQKAASHLYGVPSIVIDYGTATTIDVMDENYHFLGGLILPGVSISLDALVDKTSKLPQIELDTPKKLIGNSTKECMQNGIYFLNRMGVESIVSEIIQNYFKNDKKNQKVTVIATGGLSNYLAKTSPCFQHIHSQLTLVGLKIILDEMK